MLNARHAAATKVAGKLYPTERQIQSSILDNARLTISIMEARIEAKLPVTTASDALVHIADTNAHLIAAWRSIGLAHAELRKTQCEIGLRTFAYGDGNECPDSETSRPFTGARESELLRVIAAA